MDSNRLVFGTAYYPEYMPYDRIEKDIRMMKDAGMNVVRIAESTWSTLEPEEGVFDFSYIDRTIRAARSQGLGVIVGTPTYAVPPWLAKKDPDVLVTTKEGKAKYGHRQLVNLLNPTFRACAEAVIRALVEHTASDSAVIGFQIDNETKHYGNAGEEIKRLFADYLQEKFRDTKALNRAFYLAYWSNSIHDWEQLPDMDGCVNGGLAGEYEAFKRSMAADYLTWQADIVREYKREDQFITHNLDFEWKKFGADIAQDGYSYGVQPDMDHYEASRCLDIAGTDIYHPTQDDLTGAETAFCGDSIRSLKDDNYLVLECQAQAFKYWTPYPGQLRLHAYSHLASGAAGEIYWNWHSIHNGYETYWRGLLSHDLEPNPAYGEACVIGREWQEHGRELAGMEKHNDIALLVDNRSLTALEWFPVDRDLSYNDIVRWMYDSLYEMNLECDVVDAGALMEGNALESGRYRMVVVSALYCADERLIRKLAGFAESGGVLVSSFKSFVADVYASVYPDAQPHGMTEVFGISYQQFTEPGRTVLREKNTGAGSQIRYFMELLNRAGAESLADYDHPYWGKYAAVTRNAYGNGAAYYVGCYTEKKALKKVFGMAAEDAGIEKPAFAWPVTVRSGRTKKGEKLHYILHYSETERTVACPYESAQDILTGNVYRKGEDIRLKDWDAVILKETEEDASCRQN